MIGQNRESEQIDTELGAELLEVLLAPGLAMVEALTGAYVLSHEKTFANGAIANVSDDDFVGITMLFPLATKWIQIGLYGNMPYNCVNQGTNDGNCE